MKVEKTPIVGVSIASPTIHKDNRGELQEIYNWEKDEFGLFNHGVKQITRSVSSRHVFRGLHLQIYMNKGMRVTNGAAFIYNVDLAPNSPTYKKCVRVYADAGDNQIIYAPWWIARGFCAVEDNTTMEYIHSTAFDPTMSFTIKWNDPELHLTLPTYNPILSEKDKDGLSVEEWDMVIKGQVSKYNF